MSFETKMRSSPWGSACSANQSQTSGWKRPGVGKLLFLLLLGAQYHHLRRLSLYFFSHLLVYLVPPSLNWIRNIFSNRISPPRFYRRLSQSQATTACCMLQVQLVKGKQTCTSARLMDFRCHTLTLATGDGLITLGWESAPSQFWWPCRCLLCFWHVSTLFPLRAASQEDMNREFAQWIKSDLQQCPVVRLWLQSSLRASHRPRDLCSLKALLTAQQVILSLKYDCSFFFAQLRCQVHQKC